jgi:DNA-binding IclR family transcriptional regulator
MTVKVKSAIRMLQILDYFDEIKREANATEIARVLQIPVSSTSVLLRQMYEMGYLNRSLGDRSYIPSVRVTTLGIRIDRSLGADGPIMR